MQTPLSFHDLLLLLGVQSPHDILDVLFTNWYVIVFYQLKKFPV